jgi:hypothetical protein
MKATLLAATSGSTADAAVADQTANTRKQVQ